MCANKQNRTIPNFPWLQEKPESCYPELRYLIRKPLQDDITGKDIRFDQEWIDMDPGFEAWGYLDSYQKRLQKAEFKHYVDRYMFATGGELVKGFSCEGNRLKIQNSPQFPDIFHSKRPTKTLYTYHFGDSSSNETTDSPLTLFRSRLQVLEQIRTTVTDKIQPLKGVTILLDPGHMGNNVFEGRFIYDPDTLQMVTNEAALNLGVAFWAEKLLKAKGARVVLTKRTLTSLRNDHPSNANNLHRYLLLLVYDWMIHNQTGLEKIRRKKGRDAVLKTMQEKYEEFRTIPEDRHRAYNRRDMEDRVRMAYRIKPDLWISIHHNAWNEYDQPPLQSYIMAFIAGAFAPGELQTEAERYHFLRHVLTGHLADSKQLAAEIMQAMEKHLGLKAVRYDEGYNPYPNGYKDQFAKEYSYLVRYSKYMGEPGVYSRNLFLTKKMPGVGTLVEAGYFTDSWEVRLQLDCVTIIEGIPISERQIAYAEALVEGIEAYFNQSEVRK